MTTNSIPICDADGKLQDVHLPEHLQVENLDNIDPVVLFEQAMES